MAVIVSVLVFVAITVAIMLGGPAGGANQLGGNQLGVETALSQKVMVVALLHYVPFIQHYDAVSLPDG